MLTSIDWLAQLRPHIAGRRWLVAMTSLAETTAIVALLHKLGAASCFALGGSAGIGPPPPREQAESYSLGATGIDLMSTIRASEAAFRDLPATIQARIDAWDPAGTARVISTIFSTGTPIAGRQVFGARPKTWQLLEDKTTIDNLWHQLGVVHSKSACFTPASLPPLHGLAHLNEGQGWVLSGDSRDGFNGGSSYVRRVRTPAERAAACTFFRTHCDQVRVMPFLAGIPCSIHGMVFPDRVLAFRPVEMLVLHHAEATTFHNLGAASFWTPPPPDVTRMRRLARDVGAALRARVDYRGVFTIDGVLTKNGFRPTELNPRMGAGIGTLCYGLDSLPLTRLNELVVQGVPLDFPPEALERLVMAASATLRGASCHTLVNAPYVEDKVLPVRLHRGRVYRCSGEPSDGTLLLGPSHSGCQLFVRLKPDRVPIGPPFGPTAVSALQLARDVWQLDLRVGQAAVEAYS